MVHYIHKFINSYPIFRSCIEFLCDPYWKCPIMTLRQLQVHPIFNIHLSNFILNYFQNQNIYIQFWVCMCTSIMTFMLCYFQGNIKQRVEYVFDFFLIATNEFVREMRSRLHTISKKKMSTSSILLIISYLYVYNIVYINHNVYYTWVRN